MARRAAAAADVVIAGSSVIAEWAATVASEVVVVPTCVEPADYPAKTDYSLGDPPRLCWLGTPSQERQLQPVASGLLEVHRRTGARLVLVNAGDADLGVLTPMVDRVTWTPGFAGILPTCDAGLMPLTDDPFSRGKCAYKVLQYAAAGLPAVGSPVGANEEALALLAGVAVDRPTDWADALLALLSEPAAQRARRGIVAREGIRRHYSFEAWAPTWRAAVMGA